MNILKKLFLLALVALSCSSPAYGTWWNTIKTRATQAATKAAAFMRMQGHNVRTQAPKLNQTFWTRQAPVRNSGLLKYGAALVGTGVMAASLADTTAYAQGAQPDVFTKEQLQESMFNRRHKHQDRPYFMDIAARHIAAQDEKTIEAILYVLQVYRQEAALCLMPAVRKEFACINPVILKEILRLNPDAAQDYLQLLFTAPSPHLNALLDNFKAHSIGYYCSRGFRFHRRDRPAVNANYEWQIIHDDEQSSFAELVVQSAIQKPQAVSVGVFNAIYNAFESRVGFDNPYQEGWNNTTNALQQAARKLYKVDPKAMIDLYRRGVNTRTEEPLCIYQDHSAQRPALETVADLVVQNVDTLCAADINFIYYELEKYYYYSGMSQRQDALRVAAEKRFGKVAKDKLSADQLLGLYEKDNRTLTRTYDITLEKPLFLNDVAVRPEDVIRATIRDYQTASIETFNWAHDHNYWLTSQEERQKLEDLGQKRFGDTATDKLSANQLFNILANHSRAYNALLNIPKFVVPNVSLESVVQATVRDHETVAIETLQWIHNESLASREQKQEIRKAVRQRFCKEPIDILSLSADKLLDRYETKTTSEAPNFLRNGVCHDDIVQATKRDYKTASHKTFNWVLDNPETSQEDRDEITQLAEKRFEKFKLAENILELITTCLEKKPKVLCRIPPESPSPKTQTEAHLRENLADVIDSLKQYPAWLKPPVQRMFIDAHAKEEEETKKGNYTFYHARGPEWDFVSEFYKGLHNATCPVEKRVGKDYTFFRFDDSKSKYAGEDKYKKDEDKVDALFLNGPLFSSAKWYGNSSAQLALKNFNWDDGKSRTFTPEYILALFKLEKLYAQYKDEIEHLQYLHKKAHYHGVGNILILVLDEQNVSRVYPVWCYADHKKPIHLKDGQKTTEVKKIIQAYKSGNLKDSDKIELVLPLTKDYALDPHKGLVVHNFRAVDPETWKEYETAHDQLFEKMKEDIDKSKTV